MQPLERREFLALCGRGAAALAGAHLIGCPSPAPAQDAPPAPARYTAKDHAALRGLRGITDEQVQVHHALYESAVGRVNALLDALDALRGASTSDPGVQELRRRFGFEWNNMRLHELYFDNLTKDAAPLAADDRFAQAVTRTWGSVDAWKAELLATAKMPGVGWVICAQDPVTGGLWNGWVEDHEKGHLAGGVPLLVLDVWEHAFSAYLKPTERAKYLDDFFANVSWPAVAKRLA